MERLVIFGKGGIGKSTVACAVSASWATAQKRVLHVGCDPKHDSTIALLDGRMIEAVVDKITDPRGAAPADIVVRSHLGVDCVEAGGPGAGVGCGGRGISRMLEIFNEAKLLSPERYDVCLYDVLGDVVCGGFAAPLRRGVGEKIIIVASEELMALYAANNIARAVVHYATNGVALAGIVINLKDNDADRSMLERFARLLGTRIIAYIPRDPLVREAEYRRKTVIEYAPGAPITKLYRQLADELLAIDARSLPLPTPMNEEAFYDAARDRFHTSAVLREPVQSPGLIPPSALVSSPGHRNAQAQKQAHRAAPEQPKPLSTHDSTLYFAQERLQGALAGKDTLAKFDKAFGFDGRLRTILRSFNGPIEFHVDLRENHKAIFSIVPKGERGILETDHFVIRHHGPNIDPELFLVLRRFAARYAKATFEALSAVVRPEPADEDMLEADRHDSLFYSYGSSSAWRSFFEGDELYRSCYSGLIENVVSLHHTDLECHYQTVYTSAQVTSFFNTPSIERPTPRAETRNIKLITDLQDVDVIKGGDAKLDLALESIAALPEPPDMVLLHSSCLPEVTGDDLVASAGRVQDRLKLPVVVAGRSSELRNDMLEQLVSEDGLDAAPEPHTISIVGMPRFEGHASLMSLIEDAGIHVAAEILPDLDVRLLRELTRSRHMVVYPWARHAAMAQRLSKRLRIPALYPCAPFGVEGTRSWLMSIASALGLAERAEAAWAARFGPLEERFRSMQRRAASYRLGIIVDQPEWQKVLGSEGRLGVPIVSMLGELGFGVDLYVYQVHDERAQRPSASEGPRLYAYGSYEELMDQIASARSVAFYSEMYFDRRLTRQGKNIFSMRQLRMGLEGAMASLEELLSIAELPFYRIYKDYLGEPGAPRLVP